MFTCAALGVQAADIDDTVNDILVAGSLIFTAVYIVTDPRSMPGSRFGRLAGGLIAGILNAPVRNHGYYPEGVVIAVLVVNEREEPYSRVRAQPWKHARSLRRTQRLTMP